MSNLFQFFVKSFILQQILVCLKLLPTEKPAVVFVLSSSSVVKDKHKQVSLLFSTICSIMYVI